MKDKILLLSIISIILLLYSCDCIEGSGELIKQQRKTEEFSRLNIEVGSTIFITQGPETKVIIEAQQNILDNIITDVSNNTLDIDNTKGCIGRNKGIHIYITVPELDRITLNGSGDIKSAGHLAFKKLKTTINGSGSVVLEIESDNIYGEVNGSGSFELRGTAKVQEYSINGSGEVDASEMPGSNCEIDISGSGNCKVMTLDKLKVSITGSGSVYYKGSPEISTDITGSGSINKEN